MTDWGKYSTEQIRPNDAWYKCNCTRTWNLVKYTHQHNSGSFFWQSVRNRIIPKTAVVQKIFKLRKQVIPRGKFKRYTKLFGTWEQFETGGIWPCHPLGGAVPVWSMNDYSVDWKCYNGQRLTVDVNDSDSTWMTSEYTARTLTDSAVRHEADTCQRQYSLKKYRVKVVSTLEQTTGPTRQTCWNKSSEWVYGCYRGGAQK